MEAPNPNPAEALGLEALEKLRSASPPRYLSPSSDLSRLAREASTYLFSSLLPFCPKSLPLDSLLADEDFDAEQIWHQIDLQSRPLVSAIRRDVRRIERTAPVEMPGGARGVGEVRREMEEQKVSDAENNKDGGDEEREGSDVGSEDDSVQEEEDAEEMEEDGEEEEKVKLVDGHNELENPGNIEDDSAEDDERFEREEGDKDGKEDDDLAEDEFDLLYDDLENEDSDSGLLVKYDDFYGGKNEKSSQYGDRKKPWQSSKKLDSEGEEKESSGESDTDFPETDNEEFGIQRNEPLSTFEKQQKDMQSKIEQMENENLGPKPWTMLGEVSAAKRPKNSALEVDLDFHHNKGQPPIAAEENTHDVEDIIKMRIREGRFDEIQRAPSLPSKAPKELKELDDNKSRKGLAELYEEEYAQKTGLADAPISFSDEQKKEASLLFKKLCLKLDALSHFHFAPKPVIEDMSIQANVPALAMEEIAPLAVSDAAMLAPEEIFSGRRDFKEAAELTQADSKRRRAKMKRKFKATRAKKVGGYRNPIRQNGKEEF